jgi:hypothetical protein
MSLPHLVMAISCGISSCSSCLNFFWACFPTASFRLRACFENSSGALAGREQIIGLHLQSSAGRGGWLRCSSVKDPRGIFSFVDSEQIEGCPLGRLPRDRSPSPGIGTNCRADAGAWREGGGEVEPPSTDFPPRCLFEPVPEPASAKLRPRIASNQFLGSPSSSPSPPGRRKSRRMVRVFRRGSVKSSRKHFKWTADDPPRHARNRLPDLVSKHAL